VTDDFRDVLIRFDQLDAAEREALMRRLPEDPIERLRIYRELLQECRDFLPDETSFADISGKLELVMGMLDRPIRRRAN